MVMICSVDLPFTSVAQPLPALLVFTDFRSAACVRQHHKAHLLRATTPKPIHGHADPEEGDLRLVRNSPAVGGAGFVSGALQVFLDGAYGAVCTTNFEDTDADVACRQLGFVGGTSGGEFVLADTELTDQV